MHDPIEQAKNEIREWIGAAYGQAVADGVFAQAEPPDFAIEIPADPAHGDFAANIAMAGAKTLRMAPRAVAEALLQRMGERAGFSEVSIAGPGFLNFRLDVLFYAGVLALIRERGGDYGRTRGGAGQKVMVEFVSANPTGPMHLGNARGGVLGDCIAAVLDWTGCDVTREFYVNDAGNQIDKFGRSLAARYLQRYREDVALPEDGYQGEDITALAERFAALHGDAYVDAPQEELMRALTEFALPLNIEKMREDLGRYRVSYDVWFFESALHRDGTVERVVDLLVERGYTYELNGALWYRATDFGGEKDEVLRRSNGFYTYFAVDIAYHFNKFITRGFDRVINVWGADHHGHVARLKGAMDAIGVGAGRLDIVLMQLVSLVRDGQPVRMSKRTGKAITLTDLLDEIPVDAARFYFNLREYKSHFEFDLDLAVKESADNPVYYVQYAHARICSILRTLAGEGVTPPDWKAADYTLLQTPEEHALIRRLAMLPGEISGAARELEPSRLTRYTMDLAAAFHRFYTTCRVKDCERPLMLARAALCDATAQTIRNTLGLMRIDAPEKM